MLSWDGEREVIVYSSLPHRRTAPRLMPATPAPDPDATKLELYKRALELAKSTFQLAEGSIKTVEDKGRNNITVAPAILGFVAIVLRPDSVAAGFKLVAGWQLLALACFSLTVVAVIVVYQQYLRITQPAQADQVDPEWIVSLPETVVTELDSVASELGVYQVYIKQSQTATKLKSLALKRQTSAMLWVVGLVGLYLLFGALHLGVTAATAPARP